MAPCPFRNRIEVDLNQGYGILAPMSKDHCLADIRARFMDLFNLRGTHSLPPGSGKNILQSIHDTQVSSFDDFSNVSSMDPVAPFNFIGSLFILPITEKYGSAPNKQLAFFCQLQFITLKRFTRIARLGEI